MASNSAVSHFAPCFRFVLCLVLPLPVLSLYSFSSLAHSRRPQSSRVAAHSSSRSLRTNSDCRATNLPFLRLYCIRLLTYTSPDTLYHPLSMVFRLPTPLESMSTPPGHRSRPWRGTFVLQGVNLSAYGLNEDTTRISVAAAETEGDK